MSPVTPEFTPEEVDAKLTQIGLTGRVLVRPHETCTIFHCSRAHYYRELAPALGHFAVSEKVTGVYARRIAELLLERERDPPPVRRRGKKLS
jgi:hypothetical protein